MASIFKKSDEERAAEKAALDASIAKQKEEAQHRAWLETPLGMATTAKESGNGFFEIELEIGSSKRTVAFGSADFDKDDITWISPDLNQIHQLKNQRLDDVCITIQCYMYDQKNRTHYDYFDYLDKNGNKQQYEPDSDMDFVLFKKTIQTEWLNKTKNKPKTL
jgi:hypothetical protein